MTVPWTRSFADLLKKTKETVNLTLIRKDSAGSFVNGRYVESAETQSSIEAHVQPVNGIELQDLPEGRHGRDTIKIYTITQLFTVNESNSKQPDKVIYDSKTYQIDLVKDRHAFYKALATRVEA